MTEEHTHLVPAKVTVTFDVNGEGQFGGVWAFDAQVLLENSPIDLSTQIFEWINNSLEKWIQGEEG